MAANGHAPGSAVVGVTISFTILAFIATSLRFITRFGIVRNAGLDDLVISIAVVLSIVLTMTMCLQVKYGMGRHADSLTDHENVWSLIWFWTSVWIYYLALCFAKLSILLQYLRIFPDRNFRKACFTLMVVIVGWTLWAFFSALFACWPIQSFWHHEIPGFCLNRLAVWFSNAAVNIITDVCTALLPLPVLKSLNLPTRQKYILMAVFGLGGVTCICSILRLSGLYAISRSSDVSWDNPLAALWSSMEVNVGILCSCLPTLKGCISRYFPTLFKNSSYGSRHITPLELGNPGKSHASCTAGHSQTDNHIRSAGRLSKFGGRFGGMKAKDLKEVEEGGSQSTQSERDGGSPTREITGGFCANMTQAIPGIHVTTIVEQEEERHVPGEDNLVHESESMKGLMPAYA
ncbi:Wortmanamides biosynthesis cluster protein C [Fulvia fulva]|uniref:Wortmanamides biosynthesis cluster protein C n=1 Tax=Passalora fulva TaxID=5499 RepID=A0A9Q8PBD9_PASFU|nr:Wortmanamides biosynthesis cluster protein C [Fulvia fulva]KAK4623368.1 Wortmanamides biosynthesis cluster protein C [Fulvia fulva]UJO19369.1 Wortmanamides biosynthesis cluster protein C [Fulvia fulva]WPV15970.1 Wortmanamides biosynthesis cluster protein C [Fulvia fulva]WPV31181.1 Wortmanamides biosynthesis cluster protein C [Fulvia fulva]